MKYLLDRFSGLVNYFTVYIDEAHAQDTWPLGCEVKYNSTHTLEERQKVAQDMVNDNEFYYPVFLDKPPEKSFDKLFAAWPLRFYVIENGVLTFIAEPHGDIYYLSDLEEYLAPVLGLN